MGKQGKRNTKPMGYAIYHGTKGKGTGGGLGNHIDRAKGMGHTYRHADPSRKGDNVVFKTPKGRHQMKLPEAVKARIEEGHNGKRKVRRDAVKYLSHVFTGSHKEMLEIFSNREQALSWIRANHAFLKREFGENNILRFTLHLDEKTPHIHAVTVPLTADGRLSAKEMMGNKKALQLRQDRYAAAMSPFGLQRGIRGTGTKHETAKEYYKRIEEAMESSKLGSEIKPVKGFLGTNKGKTIEKQKESLKSSYLALKQASERETKTKTQLRSISQSNERLQKNLKAEKAKAKETNKLQEEERAAIRELLLDPEKTERFRKQLIAQTEHQRQLKRQQEQERGRSKGDGLGR